MPGPSTFLTNRFSAFLKETSGAGTVQYIAFDGSSKDSLTGDITEEAAYGGTPKTLSARISYEPSRAIRDLVGQDVRFDAIIQLSTSDLELADIELAIGDVFILPDMGKKRYVVKIVPRKQTGTDFIEQLVLVSRKKTGRG